MEQTTQDTDPFGEDLPPKERLRRIRGATEEARRKGLGNSKVVRSLEWLMCEIDRLNKIAAAAKAVVDEDDVGEHEHEVVTVRLNTIHNLDEALRPESG